MVYDEQNAATIVAENSYLQKKVARQDGIIRALKARLAPADRINAPGIAGLHNLDQLLFLVEKMFAAVLLTDQQGCITWINEGFTRLTGYELHEVFGRTTASVFHTCRLDSATVAHLEACRAQQLPFEFEVQYPLTVSNENWVRVKGHPLFDATKQALQYVYLIEDITTSKKAPLTLTKDQQRFQALVENGPGVLFEWRENFDGTCGCTYASPKLQEVFGINPADASFVAGYLHPEDRARFHQSVFNSNYLRIPWNFEGRLTVQGQPLRWFRGSSVPSGEDEQGLLYRGILQDITSFKLDQEAALETEQRWRAAMQGVGNDAWEYDYVTKAVTMSPKYRALLGYHDQAVELHPSAQPWFTNVRPQDQDSANLAILAYVSGEQSLFSVTYCVTDTEGQERWILSRGMITQRTADGNPLKVTGTFTDVTEITKAKLALEASTLRLASTISSLQEAVLLEDENRKVILVNDAFCRLFQLDCSIHQLIGTDCIELANKIKHHATDTDGFIQGINENQRQGQRVTGEIILTKDGRTLSRDYMPIYTNGHYIGHLWKIEDITNRKKDEDVLKRREEKYRGILNNLHLGLMEVDQQGQIQFVNESYCEISGYTQEELLSSSLDILHVDDRGRLLTEEKIRLRAEGISDTYEKAIKTKRGDVRWLLVSGAPFYNDEKEQVGSIGVHLDITHQKRLEIKLREAKKYAEESARAKEILLANMSHEIRTPMNAILGMSQLLAKTPLSVQQDNYLHAISTSAENLLVIINDILDQSKIDAGRMNIERIGFSLREVCEQVYKTLQYKAEDKGLGLHVQVGPDIPEVLFGDPYRITQVLLNLAGNSVKFTEKGHVWISCELAGTLGHEVVVEFNVSDTGIGIAPGFLKSLYHNFSQEDSSISRKYGGTGLGLNISQNLVRLMGGEIRIESEKQHGTISTFSLLLPIGSVADMPHNDLSAASQTVKENLHGKRVLLVEDNEYNRVLAKSFLEQAYIEVAEAENGAEAIALAREQEFDLILMDVQMPVMNGLEATAHLRKQMNLRVPIIALTANAIRGDNQKYLAAGMNDYLSKPFHENQLLKIIHDWLLDANKAGASLPLYSTRQLKQASSNDDKFVALMLRTFLDSSKNALSILRAAFEAADLPAVKAEAHRIKPSLTHLQVYQVLTPIVQLEKWEGTFSRETLQPLIETVEHYLQLVIAQIAKDLEA